MEYKNRYEKEVIEQLVRKFFTRKGTGKELIASLYHYLPNADEYLAKVAGYKASIDKLYSNEEINLLVKNFAYIYKRYYMHSFVSPVFDAEPTDLVECVSYITDIKEDEKVFIPYGGINFAIHNSQNGDYDIIISDSTHKSAFIDIAKETLGLRANTIESDVETYIRQATEKGTRYNHIIAFPSQMSFNFPEMNWVENDYKNLQANVIYMLENLLQHNGRMSIFLKKKVCYNDTWKEFREFLVQHCDTYETRIVCLPISNVESDKEGCLFCIEKKAKSHRYDSPFTFFDSCKDEFKFVDGPFISLDTNAITRAYEFSDPQFITMRNAKDLLHNYDLLPAHYPVNDDSRLKTLIDRYLTTGILGSEKKNGKTLIASLYTYTKGANKKITEAIKPLLRDIEGEISRDNISFLVARFSKVVEYCYKKVSCLSEDTTLTKGYVDLIRSLLCDENNLPEHKCYLPFGDLRLAAICPECSFHCVDSCELDWAIESVIQETLGLNGSVFTREKYNHTESGFPHKVYDRILALPTLGKQDISSIVDDLINCIEHKLGYGGSMAILLPREACYAPGWEKLRRFTAQDCNDITLSVISLRIPTSIDIHEESLFIIKKHLSPETQSVFERVVLMDADKEEFLLSDTEVGIYGLNIPHIVETFKRQDSSSVIKVPTEFDQAFNLLAARYFSWNELDLSARSRHLMTPLEDVISLIPRVNHVWTDVQNAGDRIITREHLSHDHLSCRITPALVEFQHSKGVDYTSSNGGYLSISHGGIIVGKIEGEPEDAQIGIDKMVIHFQVNSNLTSLDYILKVLSSSDYITQQVKHLVKGYSWRDQYIHEQDLKRLLIFLPSLEEQKEELLADSRRGLEAKDAEIKKNFDEFRRNMHMQKHKIGQTISALCSWVEQINYAREIGNGVVDDSAIIFPAYNTSAKDIFEKLTITAEKLQKEILALDSSYGMEKDVEDIALADFLDEYISKNDVWSGRKFELVWDSWAHRYTKDLPMIEFDESDEYHVKSRLIPGEFIIKAGDPMEYIRGTYRSLETILDNIIANALSHGFKRQDKIYKIKFDIITDDEQVILLVSNNGEPLHERMKSDEVFTYGHTSGDDSHSGIGCYQIKDYMDTLKGSVEIISTPEEEFTVTYKLTFVNANPSVSLSL